MFLSPQRIFLFFALTWGTVQLVLMPPFQVPDEPGHFVRAWGVARLQLVCRDLTVTLPENVAALVRTLNPEAVKSGRCRVGQALALLPERLSASQLSVAERFCAYHPLGYAPQALGIRLAAALDLSPLYSLYFGRWFNLICASLLIFWAITIAPWGKDVFLCVGLFPMTIHQLASLSNDALTLSGLMVFTALMLKCSRQSHLPGMTLLGLFLLSMLLIQVKPGYIAFLLLFLLLQPEQFDTRKGYVLYLVLVFWGNLAVFLLLSRLVDLEKYISLIPHINTKEQLEFILQNPLEFTKIFIATLLQQPIFTFKSMVGIFGWLTLHFHPYFYIFIVAVVLAILITNTDTIKLLWRQRLIFAGVAAATLIIILTLQYLFWTEPRGPLIITFQGRYFIAVCVLVLLSMYRPGLYAGNREPVFVRTRYLLLSGLFLIMAVYSSVAVVEHYREYYAIPEITLSQEIGAT